MPFRETKQDHARIFSDGFLKIMTMYDPNSDYEIPEIEEDAKRIAHFLAANTSACFIRQFKAELDKIGIYPPLTGFLPNNKTAIVDNKNSSEVKTE